MEPRRPQRLVGIDVADAGEEALVEQEWLEAALPTSDSRPEAPRRERRLERLRPEALEALAAAELSGEIAAGSNSPRDPHPTELADVAEPQLAPIRKRQDQANVRVLHDAGAHDEQLA